MNCVISGTGLHTPPESISNEELVGAFNAYVQRFNAEHAEAIEKGEVEALQESSAEFILKASGIASRHVVDRSGILDPERMTPNLRPRTMDEQGILCEKGALEALLVPGNWEDVHLEYFIDCIKSIKSTCYFIKNMAWEPWGKLTVFTNPF